jgi:hypothetical protein
MPESESRSGKRHAPINERFLNNEFGSETRSPAIQHDWSGFVRGANDTYRANVWNAIFFCFFFQTRGNSLRLTGSEKYTNARDSDAYSATVDMRR